MLQFTGVYAKPVRNDSLYKLDNRLTWTGHHLDRVGLVTSSLCYSYYFSNDFKIRYDSIEECILRFFYSPPTPKSQYFGKWELSNAPRIITFVLIKMLGSSVIYYICFQKSVGKGLYGNPMILRGFGVFPKMQRVTIWIFL